jgi:hypothetical protein
MLSFVRQAILLVMKQRHAPKPGMARGMLNKSKFDEQIILSPVEGAEETPSSRRHLIRLTAVDARLSSIRESDERADFPSGEITTRPCDP